MSAEDVAIVRAGFASYNRRDLDGTLENWAPNQGQPCVTEAFGQVSRASGANDYVEMSRGANLN